VKVYVNNGQITRTADPLNNKFCGRRIMSESYVSRTATVLGAVSLVAIAAAMVILARDEMTPYRVPKGFYSQIEDWGDNGEHERVIALCRDRLVYHPHDTTAIWYLGVALEQTGQPSEAIATFLKLKELSGTNGVPRVDVYLEKLEPQNH
jgi:hypothetical protein